MTSHTVRKLLPVTLMIGAIIVLLGLGELLARQPAVGVAERGVRAPSFSPSPGVYDRSINVTLRPTDPRGQLIFTLDGTLPTVDVGVLYAHPLRLDATSPKVVIIRAVEVLDGVPGPVSSVTYVMGVRSAVPVISLIADPVDLWDAERGLFANLWGRGMGWEHPVHVDFLPAHSGTGFALSAGLRIHGAEPESAPKQSVRLYFRSEYGAARLEFPLFTGHPHQPDETQSYKRLLLQAGDRSGQWTLFRDQLLVDTAVTLGLHVTQGRFVHVFVNGESWGLYRLGERIDRFFLEDNHGIHNADLVQDGKQREGVDDGWDALIDWVVANDMADPANYAEVAAQVDVDDLIDWAVLQLYFGFPVSELYAARAPAGRWFFLYEGGSQAFADYPEAPLTLFQGTEGADFAVLLRALLRNTAYRERFTRRLTVVLNTVLTDRVIQARAQTFVAMLQDDILYEEARWPSPFLWQKNVEAFVGSFAPARPRWVLARVGEVLALGSVADLQLDFLPDTVSGKVYLEGMPLTVDDGSWSGIMLTGGPVQFMAVPSRDMRFVGWTAAGEQRAQVTGVTLTPHGAGHFIAEFAPLTEDDALMVRPDDVLINEVWVNDNGTFYATAGNRPIEGDWIELLVQRESVDLRGWRLTDNDTKTGDLEGSLIFPDVDALAVVPRNTVILVLATVTDGNTFYFPVDDVDPRDRRMLFYVGNGTLDTATDPGFGLGTGGDNLVVLSPGTSVAFADDVGVDFVAEGNAVTPFTFGVLADGVTFDIPFRQLGDDDGALFLGCWSNDALEAWLVDPPAYQSGDELRVDSPNIVTPGRRNLHQHFPLPAIRCW